MSSKPRNVPPVAVDPVIGRLSNVFIARVTWVTAAADELDAAGAALATASGTVSAINVANASAIERLCFTALPPVDVPDRGLRGRARLAAEVGTVRRLPVVSSESRRDQR